MNDKEIKEIRNSLNLSQEEFAKLIGVSKNTVYNYENGSKIPESKITILRNLKDKNTPILTKSDTNYTSGHDKKIAEYRAEIEKIEEKIKKWEDKLKSYPGRKSKYEGIIREYENQLLIFNSFVTIALEAKDDFLKHNK